jgi:translation initiation factor 2 alpha subunit (eIF-2alpha)
LLKESNFTQKCFEQKWVKNGEAFGMGYTAVTGAVQRGERYLEEDERFKKTVQRIINNI